MEPALSDYLRQLGFDADEIQCLCAVCPGLEVISAERAFENIALVTRYGYPAEDLDGLIAVNPSFLLNNPAHLETVLQKLGNNIEAALKDNPQLI